MLVKWSVKLTACLVAIILAFAGYVTLFVVVIKTVASASSTGDPSYVFLSMVFALIVEVLVLLKVLYSIITWGSRRPA
ncbi:hypothetical protein MTO96_012753 [Rhipicephalus appendiculatus]